MPEILSDEELIILIEQASTSEELIRAINLIPGKLDNSYTAKRRLIGNLNRILGNKDLIKEVLAGVHADYIARNVTETYGIRKKLIEILEKEHDVLLLGRAETSQIVPIIRNASNQKENETQNVQQEQNLKAQIQQAKTLSEIYEIIDSHKDEIKDKSGTVIKKRNLLRALKRIEERQVEVCCRIAQTGLSKYEKKNIPEAFGLQNAIVTIAQAMQSSLSSEITNEFQFAPSIQKLIAMIQKYEDVFQGLGVEASSLIDRIESYFKRDYKLVQLVESNFNFDRQNIPDLFGLREQLVKLAKSKINGKLSNMEAAIAKANRIPELESIFDQYSYIINTHDYGFKDLYAMRSHIKLTLLDPLKLEEVVSGKFDFDKEQIPKQNGIRACFIRIANIQKQEQQSALIESLSDAKSFEAFCQLINDYPGILRLGDGEVVNKFDVIDGMKMLFYNKKNFEYIATGGKLNWDEHCIPKELGVLENFMRLVEARQKILEEKAKGKDSPASVFYVPPSEWEYARNYFFKNNATKCDKKAHGLQYSFIKISGEIYAINTGDCLGEGNYGKVKLIQNQQNDVFAVKIEGRDKRADDDAEIVIMRRVEQYFGEATRDYGKSFKGKFADKKLYTIMPLLRGKELHDDLYFGQRLARKEIGETQRILMAIQATKAISSLHEKGVIHGDIKPENFMINVKGDQINIISFDFGFSMVVDTPDGVVEDKAKGTEFYMPPEILEAKYSDDENAKAKYSFASDIYALGKMLEYDLQLDLGERVYDAVFNIDPKQRMSLESILDALYQKLSEQKDLNSTATKMLAEHQIEKAKRVEVASSSVTNASSINKKQ